MMSNKVVVLPRVNSTHVIEFRTCWKTDVPAHQSASDHDAGYMHESGHSLNEINTSASYDKLLVQVESLE